MPNGMSFTLFFSLLLLFWLALHRFLGPSSRARSLLPSHALTRRTHSDFTLHGVHLRYEYTGWNGAHAALARWMADERRRSLRRAAVGLYECGTVLGVVGMVAALGLMGRTVITLMGRILSTTDTKYDPELVTNATMALLKRAFVDGATSQPIETMDAPSAFDVHLLVCLIMSCMTGICES